MEIWSRGDIVIVYYNKESNIVIEHEQLREMVEQSEYDNPKITFQKATIDGRVEKTMEEYIKDIPFSDQFQIIELNSDTNIRELDEGLFYTSNDLVRNEIRDIRRKQRELNYLR